MEVGAKDNFKQTNLMIYTVDKKYSNINANTNMNKFPHPLKVVVQ